MGKKKCFRRAEEGFGDTAAAPVQGMKRKRVSAGGQPCPGESPTRKKKSLSQFGSPSPNSKRLMQATIAGKRQTKKKAPNRVVNGGVPNPVLSSRAFEHVLALDAVLRAAGEARLNSSSNSPVPPSQVGATQGQQSPPRTIHGEHGHSTRDQGMVQGAGVHVHIYVTPPEAQRQQRQDQITTDPLVRARRILEFPGNPEPVVEVPEKMVVSSHDGSPIAVEHQQKNAESPAVDPVLEVPKKGIVSAEGGSPIEVRQQPNNAEASAVEGGSPIVVEQQQKCAEFLDVAGQEKRTIPEDDCVLSVLQSTAVPIQAPEVVHCVEQNRLQRVSSEEAALGSTPRSPCGGLHMGGPHFVEDAAPENELNCDGYGQEGKADLSPPETAKYSEEFVERLLSLLSRHEREEFLRTHPLVPPTTRLPILEPGAQTVDVNLEVQAALPMVSSGEHQSKPFFPSCEAVVLSSTHSGDLRKDKLLTEDQFKRTLRQLARDERKYKKKQAKKVARDKKGKYPVTSEMTEKVPAKISTTLKPPLAPVGPSSKRNPRKDAVLSSGGSSGTPSSSAAVGTGDSMGFLSSWDADFPIPPFEVNSLAAPTGEFWEHMRRFALEQAPFEFPWHLEWNRQCPELKARFTLKLRKVYPGPWDAKSVMRAVGANLRERRTRLKRKFEKSKKRSQVTRPLGCSKGSWFIIYESTKDAKKQKKAKLCKAAADRRFQVQGPTHRCGPRGIKGLHDRFVDYFNRPPTNDELEYGKVNGWADLKLKVEKATKVLHADKTKAVAEQGSVPPDPTTADRVGGDEVNLSSSSDTSSSGNSEDSSSDADTSKSDSDEE